jgi:hypothetical protein
MPFRSVMLLLVRAGRLPVVAAGAEGSGLRDCASAEGPAAASSAVTSPFAAALARAASLLDGYSELSAAKSLCAFSRSAASPNRSYASSDRLPACQSALSQYPLRGNHATTRS